MAPIRLICALMFFLLCGFSKNSLKDELYLNYKAALENESTTYFFAVIKIKDLSSGVIKEICAPGNLILGAFHRELKKGYDKASRNEVLRYALSNKNRYFEFTDSSALRNIDFYSYDSKKVDSISLIIKKNRLIDSLKLNHQYNHKGDTWYFENMIYYAHNFFNKGFLTGESGCVGGTTLYLQNRNRKRVRKLFNHHYQIFSFYQCSGR